VQNQQFEWWKAKTGLLIREVQCNYTGKMMTGISEHGQRLHFPAHFIERRATYEEQVYPTHLATGQEAVRLARRLRDLKEKGMGFHAKG
jgi:hypothetical protein